MNYLVKQNNQEGKILTEIRDINEIAKHITDLAQEEVKGHFFKIWEFNKNNVEVKLTEKDIAKIALDVDEHNFNKLTETLKSNLPDGYQVVSVLNMFKYIDITYMVKL